MDTISYLLGKKSSGGGSATLQEKSVTITENGDTTIKADTGYDGLSKVNVNTNVSGGSLETPTKKSDILNQIGNSLSAIETNALSIKNNYTAYLNQGVTLYTPNEFCKSYMIQKRNGGKYRVVWSPYSYCKIVSSTIQGFDVFGAIMQPNSKRDITSLEYDIGYNTSSVITYYSNEFSSLNALLTAMQSSNSSSISYTNYTNGLTFSGQLDNGWVVPITNCLLIDGEDNIVTNGIVLSKDETITGYPTS